MEDHLLNLLEEKGWKIDRANKKIIEGPVRTFDASFLPTNVPDLCKEV